MSSERTLQVALFLLDIAGVNPKVQNKWSVLRFINYNVCAWGLGIEFALQALMNIDDQHSVSFVSNGFACYLVAWKTISMLLSRRHYLRILKKLNQFRSLDNCSPALQLEAQTLFSFITRYVLFYTFLLLVVEGVYFTQAALSPYKLLPYYTYHPIDRAASPDYEIAFILHTYISIVLCPPAVGYDMLFLVIVANIVCQLRMIREKLKNISVKKQPLEKCLEEVYSLAELHDLVLRCIKDLDKAYSIFLMNQFLACIMLICACMLGMTTNGMPGLDEVVFYTPLMALFLCGLFLYCFIGTHITHESFQVSESVYDSDWWVETQPELRRAYVRIIQRANKEETLTAGGMFVLNFETFVRVMNFSLSFFALLQAKYSRHT